MELSKYACTYVVPISLLSYYFISESRSSLYIHMIIVCLIGCLDVTKRSEMEYFPIFKIKYNIFLKLLAIISHFILIYFLFLFPFPKTTSIYSHILLIVANLIIYCLPWWPYLIKRNDMGLIYNVLYCIMYFFLDQFYKKN